MEKRNRHGAIWSETDEQPKTIGYIQAEELAEAGKQTALFLQYGVDEFVYDDEELEEAFNEGDTVVVIVNGIVTKR